MACVLRRVVAESTECGLLPKRSIESPKGFWNISLLWGNGGRRSYNRNEKRADDTAIFIGASSELPRLRWPLGRY